MASRYSSYQALITDIAREAGEEGSELDAILLNILQSTVDLLNNIRGKFREETAHIDLVSGQWEYPTPDDYGEVVDRKTSLYYLEGTRRVFIPIVSARHQFYSGWDTASTGTPDVAFLYGTSKLLLRPTPNVVKTTYLDYYKRLTTPALNGAVQIPDHYLAAIRAPIAARLESYRESPEKASIHIGLLAEIRRVLDRDYAQQSLPNEVLDSEEDW